MQPETHGRIALFVATLAGGGAERVMLTLAGGFLRAGHEVDILTAQAEGPYLSEIPANARLVDFGTGRVIKALPKLCGYLRRERPAVLLATLTHANVVAILARTITRSNTRVFVREASTLSLDGGTSRLLRGRMLPMLARKLYWRADGVIAPSSGVRADLVETQGISQESVKVIYNPVIDEGLFAKAAETPSHPWMETSDRPLILAVGRLTRAKDFATLIRAFHRIRPRHPARLMILGEGEERGELERLVRSLHLEDDVALPGFVANPFSYMSRASVFVLSSIFEGLPNALIQALALGTQVVATDCPSGPREILHGGRYGSLVPVGDEETMAMAIVERMRMRRDAKSAKSACARFLTHSVTQDYLDLFRGKALA